jgi:hypothetical protein
LSNVQGRGLPIGEGKGSFPSPVRALVPLRAKIKRASISKKGKGKDEEGKEARRRERAVG